MNNPTTTPRLHFNARHLLAAVLAGSAGLACAQPQPTASTDGVRFDNPAAGVTNITAPNNAIIDYASFNVASGQTVNFIQPDAASRVLNRINSNTPSQIDGAINANGIVYLVNPAGVTFGGGAVVDVAGLYAAAGSLTDQDFLNGVDLFGDVAGTIRQNGIVRADSIAALIGREVINTGTISVPNGTVVLASGDKVMLGSPLGGLMVQVAATPRTEEGGVAQDGTVQAAELSLITGDIYSLALTGGLRTSGPGDAGFTLPEADTDGDGDIDFDDIDTARANFDGPLPHGVGIRTQTDGDVDGDGDVDNSDFAHLIALYTGPITRPPVDPPIAGPFNLDESQAITRLPVIETLVNLTEADLSILRDQLGVSPRPALAQERIEKAQARALYNDLRPNGDQSANPDGSMTIANTRLDADVVRQALQLYRDRLEIEGTAPAQRVTQIQQAVHQAYRSYATSNTAESFEPQAFVASVREDNPELFDELSALEELRRLSANMGLSELEKENSERVIIDRARPEELTFEQMKAALESAGALSRAPAEPDAG